MFRRALLAKKLALSGLEHTFQHFAALRGLRVGDAHSGNFEALFRIPLGVALANAQS